jgi:hypothetical protein
MSIVSMTCTTSTKDKSKCLSLLISFSSTPTTPLFSRHFHVKKNTPSRENESIYWTSALPPLDDTRSGTITFAAFNLPSMNMLRSGSGNAGGTLPVTDRTPCTRMPTCLMMERPVVVSRMTSKSQVSVQSGRFRSLQTKIKSSKRQKFPCTSYQETNCTALREADTPAGYRRHRCWRADTA